MSDIFRKEYKELTILQKQRIDLIKTYADDLLKKIQESVNVCSPREYQIAITKLEECVMWAVKSIT
jgi:hypothetical protein